MKKAIYITLLLIVVSQVGSSQVYVEKQTRHRFAQLNMGLDIATNFGGTTKYLSTNNDLETLSLTSTFVPRFIIGGTHFWGHADLYIAIPLLHPEIKEANQRIKYLRSVETVFKYYPWRIEHNKVRPYLGFSIAPFYYEQSNNNLDYGNGPELRNINFPLLGGVTLNNKNHLFELGITWNYSNKQNYHISRTVGQSIETPPIHLNLSFRFMLETTVSAEKDWESGRTQEITEKLSGQKKLNSIYIGVGLSSAFWLRESSYNRIARSYIEKYENSIIPDFSIGYYLDKPDVNIAMGYRGYGINTSAYGAFQALKRKSVVFELTKNLFDYHGFVPFIGPAISYENLIFKESFEDQPIHDLIENKIGYGVVFGWDIRPNRIQSWILRTNLRWYPNLKLEVNDESSISFDNIEFNFIQLIIYPSRMFK